MRQITSPVAQTRTSRLTFIGQCNAIPLMRSASARLHDASVLTPNVVHSVPSPGELFPAVKARRAYGLRISLILIVLMQSSIACTATEQAPKARAATRPSDRADVPGTLPTTSFQGTNRVVLVFMNPASAGEGESAAFGYRLQLSHLDGSTDGLALRDVVVIGVEPDGGTIYEPVTTHEATTDPEVDEAGLRSIAQFSSEAADSLRAQFSAADSPLNVIILDKTGKQVFADNDGVEYHELFDIIDSIETERREE